MNKVIKSIKLSLLIFISTTLTALIFGLISGEMDYFYLSIFLGLPFLVGLIMAIKTESKLLTIFAITAMVSGWLSPLGFFFERETFTYGGFLAVKDFEFSVFQFIGFYYPIIIGYFLMLSIAMLFNLRRRSVLQSPGGRSHFKSPSVSPKQLFTRKGSMRMRLLLVFAIFVFAAINWWMFNNSIGLTGIDPPNLPFKLSGTLYYMSRFGFPFILVYLLTRFRANPFDLTLLIGYACFASLTSVSKTTLFLLFIPVLIAAYLNKQYVTLCLASIMLAIFYPIVGMARSFVYFVEGGFSVRNIEFALPDVIQSLAFDQEFSSDIFLSGPIAIISRIGGGQDVVLAAQYNGSQIYGSLVEFIRLYIFDFWSLASDAQELMYAFQPEVSGYATGDGGFFAHILLVSGGSIPIILILSLYLGLVLALADSTYVKLLSYEVPKEFCLFYAIFFCIFFFVLSIPLWLNVFVVLTSVGVRMKVFRVLIQRL